VSVAAILLAAGTGSRFEAGHKLTASLDGRPLVRHAAQAALASRARPVVAVLGHEREAVAAALEGLDLALVDNPDYARGLSTSLKRGFAALPPDVEAALVLLADMPRIGPTLLDELAAAWKAAGRPAALVPTHGGRRGNPVVLSRALEPAIMALEGDHGAGPLLRGRAGVAEWPVDEAGVALDVDTREALAALGGSPPG
jgi:molybdenum cofactor cytidylyltransferase